MRFFLAPILLTLVPVVLHAEGSPQIHDRLLQATAWVRTTTQGVGTGWVVDAKRRWLVTNLHIVGDQERVEAFFVVREDGKPITERRYYLENQKRLHEEGLAVRGKTILRHENSDLALVELEKLPEGVTDLPLATTPAAPGERVHSLGNRHDAEALWLYTAGEVRQAGSLADGYFWRGKKLAAAAPCLILQSPIHPGDSGSAVVNDRGEVVGVISGGRWQAPQASIAIQVSQVRTLLAAAQKEPPREPKPEPVAPTSATEHYLKMLAATVWVRPSATEGRGAGWVVDRQRRLLLTTASAAGASDVVDVVFPLLAKGQVVAEAAAYTDRIALRKSGHLMRGVVLARDPKRDLALIELESIPAEAAELKLSAREPLPAEKVHAVSHPSGVELLWLYSAGTVRQAANLELVGEPMGEPARPRTLLLQVPHQAGSSGGPIVDERGEAVGLLAAKEGTQQQLGYAIAAAELRSFIDSAKPLFAPNTAAEFGKRGRYLSLRGSGLLAIAALTKAVELEPKNLELRRDALEALIRAGRSAEIETQARLLEQEPSVPAKECVAKALLALGKRKEAALCGELILKLDRKNATGYLARSVGRDAREALTDLDEAIALAPEFVEAYRHRAAVHESLGDDEQAIADYSRAIELDPYAPQLVRQRAALYLKRNEAKRAIADGQRLVELSPSDADSYRILARAWLRWGDEAKALPELVAALRWQANLRKEILEEVIAYGKELARRWPDDPGKRAGWYEQALKSIGDAVGGDRGKEIKLAASGRKAEWDDKAWGDELARRIRELEK